MLIHGVLVFLQLLRDTNQLFNHDLVRFCFFFSFRNYHFLLCMRFFGCLENEWKSQVLWEFNCIKVISFGFLSNLSLVVSNPAVISLSLVCLLVFLVAKK